MKKAWILISGIAIVAFVLSCTKTETTPEFPKSNASFSATPSATTVAAAASDSLTDAITFTWTDPKYAVGLSKSKFTIMVGSQGDDFASFASKSFTGVLLGALKGKELNKMAIQFGGVVGQSVILEMKVVASQENNAETKESSVVQVTVTPYDDLTLTTSSLSVVCTAANADKTGDTLTWTPAFAGFNGPVTYQIQYAKGGTSFASPTSVSVSSLMKVFTKLELNKAAGSSGVAPGAAGDVDFRIKATNSSSEILYSNTITIHITTYVAYNSIGIIGDATAGSWGTDTDMYRPNAVTNPGDWTVTLYLIGGKSAKFRADDDWANNWGDTAFPSGTGSSGGPNIPITNSGYYKVNFNAGTGAYSFNLLSITDYTSPGISVIGDATPGGWGADTPLTQSGSDPNVWTGTVAMTSGGAFKFRTTGDWNTNWGFGDSSPKGQSGWGAPGGANIPVSLSTTYFVYINTATSEFFFGDVTNNANAGTPYSGIGIIGDATPNGWGGDTNLTKNPANPYMWSGKVVLTGPGQYAKFRTLGDWGTNWGNGSFPNGIGTQGGANIPVTAGTAQITFNSATGEYSFDY